MVTCPGGSLTNHDYQSLSDVDRDAAYRELREVVHLGLVASPPKRGRGPALDQHPMSRARRSACIL